jgi:hypothetical protein
MIGMDKVCMRCTRIAVLIWCNVSPLHIMALSLQNPGGMYEQGVSGCRYISYQRSCDDYLD